MPRAELTAPAARQDTSDRVRPGRGVSGLMVEANGERRNGADPPARWLSRGTGPAEVLGPLPFRFGRGKGDGLPRDVTGPATKTALIRSIGRVLVGILAPRGRGVPSNSSAPLSTSMALYEKTVNIYSYGKMHTRPGVRVYRLSS